MSNQYTKGDQFNNWTVLEFAGRNKKNEQLYSCQCICGTIREVRRDNLGKVMGCGCVRRTYKERAANPAIPKNIKVKNAQTAKPKIKAKKIKREHSTSQNTNQSPSDKSTNILIARKLEQMALEKELASHYSFA